MRQTKRKEAEENYLSLKHLQVSTIKARSPKCIEI
jgi:hypothetical protein